MESYFLEEMDLESIKWRVPSDTVNFIAFKDGSMEIITEKIISAEADTHNVSYNPPYSFKSLAAIF